MMAERRATRILLVEDELADVEFTQYALDRGSLAHDLTVSPTGGSALDHIYDTQGTDDFPDLVLLDVNLPDMTGMEVVAAIRSDPMTASLPVIVLSTSNYAADVESAYAAHANAYVQKPARLAGFEDLVRSIEQFWFDQAILPSNGHN